MNTPLFYSFLFIHIISFIVGFGSVILVDTFGLLFLLKRVKIKIVNEVANVAERLIWLGLGGLIISGTVLILHKGFIDNLTWIKLFFVAMLICNGVFLYTIKKSMEKLGDIDTLPPDIMFKTGLASTISQLGWWGAIIIGFIHRHISHYFSFPPAPWHWAFMIIVLLLIAGAAIIGHIILTGSHKKNREKSETQKTA